MVTFPLKQADGRGRPPAMQLKRSMDVTLEGTMVLLADYSRTTVPSEHSWSGTKTASDTSGGGVIAGFGIQQASS